MLRFGGSLTQRAPEWEDVIRHTTAIVEAVPGTPCYFFGVAVPNVCPLLFAPSGDQELGICG